MVLIVVEADVFLQTAGILITIESVEMNVLINTTNAMNQWIVYYDDKLYKYSTTTAVMKWLIDSWLIDSIDSIDSRWI